MHLIHIKLVLEAVGKAHLWRQVATGVIKGLGADVATPERLGGDNITQRREGLFHGGTD